MIISGFALEKISAGQELDWWVSIPPTVRVPGERITVDAADAGWQFEDYRIVAKDKQFPDSQPIIPNAISDRQFAHALKRAGIISHDEAMAFVQTGTIPAALQSVIDAIPDQQQREDAELLVAGAQTFYRDHPMTEALRLGMGKTSEEIDDLWRQGAAL